MYMHFGRNIKNYLKLCEGREDYRARIAQILRGLADVELYKSWEKEDQDKYREVNNLVYHINKNIDKYQTFETFARDLWAYEYVSEEDKSFSMEDVEEQLKLINLCLRGMYW